MELPTSPPRNTVQHVGSRPGSDRLRRAVGLLDTTFRHPALVGAATALVALVVVALRVEVAGQGHVGNLVLLGSRFVVPGSHVGVPVVHGNGYDGQFYYRLALDPLDFSPHAQGIVMDSPQRYERVVYPVLAWTLSAGHASLVPWSLIAVNVVCLGALGWLGALVARDGGRHPAWGLLVPAYFGFVWSLSRDLTEIVECTFIVAGLVALRRRRPVLCGLALSAAVLSRETALVVVACIGLVQLARWLAPGPGAVRRPESAPASHLTAWVLPVAVFAGWQGVVRSKIGHLPLLASGQHNLDVPFAGLARGFSHYAALLPGKSAVLWFGELAVLVFVVVTAARHLKTSAAPLHERLAWGAYGVLSLCLAPGIWLGDVGFRSLDDVYVLSVLVVLASPRRTRVIAPVMGLTWLVVAAELVKVI